MFIHSSEPPDGEARQSDPLLGGLLLLGGIVVLFFLGTMPIGAALTAWCFTAAFGAFRGRIRMGMSCIVALVVGVVFMAIPAFTHVRRSSSIQEMLANEARIVTSAAQQYFLVNPDAKNVRIEVDETTGAVSGPLGEYVSRLPRGAKITQIEIKGSDITFTLEHNGWEVQMGAGGPVVRKHDPTHTLRPSAPECNPSSPEGNGIRPKLVPPAPPSGADSSISAPPTMAPIDRQELVTRISHRLADLTTESRGMNFSLGKVELDGEVVNLFGSIGCAPEEAVASVSAFFESLRRQSEIRQAFRSVSLVSLARAPQTNLFEFELRFTSENALPDKNKDSTTSLMRTAENGPSEMVKPLLRKDADPDVAVQSVPPLQDATNRARTEIAELPPLSGEELLHTLASSLHPTGSLRLEGKPYLLFAHRKLKAGDEMTVSFGGAEYKLTIVEIGADWFRVRHNSEELTRAIKSAE